MKEISGLPLDNISKACLGTALSNLFEGFDDLNDGMKIPRIGFARYIIQQGLMDSVDIVGHIKGRFNGNGLLEKVEGILYDEQIRFEVNEFTGNINSLKKIAEKINVIDQMDQG